MRTTKLIIGIASIVLTFLIGFQSCVATVGDALSENGGSSGFSGMMVAILMLISGIVAIAARDSRGGNIFCFILYLIAGVTGITMQGIFADLIIWGAMNLIFACIFLISILKAKKKGEKENGTENK